MMINNISVVTPNYPSPRFIERGAFVEALVGQWNGAGIHVDVIAPVSFANRLRGLRRRRQDASIAGSRIMSPCYPTFSAGSFGAVDLRCLSNWSFDKTAFKTACQLPAADVYYGQFLLGGGTASAWVGKKFGRPAFADLGESKLLEGMSVRTRARASNVIRMLDGVVCVSDRLRDEAFELGMPENKVLLAPNHPNTQRFRPLDRQECRARLSLPQDAFIVIFTGYFIDRKGPLRVLSAIERLDHPAFGVFLGRGPQKPEGPRVLHAGPVPNTDVPAWLNAANLMILPTLAEGNCNAIAEALACGLPVISSDIPDIRGQVPADGGILVDPRDVGALSSAIAHLIGHPESLRKMGENLRVRQLELAGFNRGRKILDWMNSVIADDVEKSGGPSV